MYWKFRAAWGIKKSVTGRERILVARKERPVSGGFVGESLESGMQKLGCGILRC